MRPLTIVPIALLSAVLAVATLCPPAEAGILPDPPVVIIPELIGTHELEGLFEVGTGCLLNLGLGFDCYEGRIVLTFEEPASLAVGSLVMTAEIIDPDDSDLISRLPSGVNVPEEFPVLIRILDEAGDIFTFSDAWRFEIQTRNLEFEARSPLRLFRADEGCNSPGCPFEDFTRTTGIGSFRAGGSFGTFSEFLIASDLRPQRVVVAAKFQKVSDTIIFYRDLGEISTVASVALQARLAAASSAVGEGQYEDAVDEVYDFMDLIDFYDGNGISDGWDPGESLVSVVGVLFGLAESLIYSVEDQARPQPISSGGTRQLLSTEGGLEFEVTVDFAKPTSFQPQSLDLEADDVNPLDPVLLARLPNGVSIDPNFAVVFTIGADPFSRPAARGDWQVLLRTRQLDFQASSPFRLFKADFGGDYADVTTSLGIGSLLAGAHVGRFDEFAQSEYLLVRDQRNLNAVILRKVSDLETMLSNFSLDPAVKAALGADLAAAEISIDGEDPGQAIMDMDAFLATIDDNAGVDLNDIWRAGDNRLNHAGLLAAKAKTLQFSLALAKAPLDADPADVNRDGKVDAADVFALIERVYGAGSLDAKGGQGPLGLFNTQGTQSSATQSSPEGPGRP